MPNVMDDYITVAQRIERFYERYPEGSLQSRIVELTEDRVVMEASAYRSADDERPGIGYSSMPIPARNQMLRDSEIETCETSAWGRAIAALGFEVKKAVASQNEIDAKRSERNPRVGADDYEPPAVPIRNGLIGIAKRGQGARSKAELRQEAERGWALGFRLQAREGDKGGTNVEVFGDLAAALAAVLDTWIDKPVTVWGSIVDRTYDTKSGHSVPYQVLELSRIQTPDFILPAPDPSGAGEAIDEPDLTLTRQAGSVAAEPTASGTPGPGQPSAPTPVAPLEPLGAPEAATGLPSSESDAEELVKPCGAVGSGLGVVCTLEKGHAGRHKELATDGRTLASW